MAEGSREELVDSVEGLYPTPAPHTLRSQARITLQCNQPTACQQSVNYGHRDDHSALLVRDIRTSFTLSGSRQRTVLQEKDMLQPNSTSA